MLICPACETENPEGFNFCGKCGTKLEAAPVREERKVITALFCVLKWPCTCKDAIPRSSSVARQGGPAGSAGER